MLIYDMPHTLHAGMSSDKFVNEPTGSRGLKWCIHSGNKNDKMFKTKLINIQHCIIKLS
jgi:hypothetical protein